MKKIPTLYERCNPDRSIVSSILNPACQWVIDGEGVATVKYDGTCMLYDGYWRARREVKPGKDIPENFVEAHYDLVTGKRQGWVPLEGSGFAVYAYEALCCDPGDDGGWDHGTYELCGPKINGNPEGLDRHVMFSHARATVIPLPKAISYEFLKEFFESPVGLIEGIVWHHPDGRMAKIKRRDFGFRWPINEH